MGASGSFGRCPLEAEAGEWERWGGKEADGKSVNGAAYLSGPLGLNPAGDLWRWCGAGHTSVPPRVKVAVFTLHFHPSLAEGCSCCVHSDLPLGPWARQEKAGTQGESAGPCGAVTDCWGSRQGPPRLLQWDRQVHTQPMPLGGSGSLHSTNSPPGMSLSLKLRCSICLPWRTMPPSGMVQRAVLPCSVT